MTTITESILELLRGATAPLTADEIFRGLEDAVDRQQVARAVHYMAKHSNQIIREKTEARGTNGKFLFAYRLANPYEPKPSSATPTTARANPPAPAAAPEPSERRGGRKTTPNANNVTLGQLARAACEAGARVSVELESLEAKDPPPHPAGDVEELELAIWNNGSLQIEIADASVLLSKDKVDQLKRFIDRLYVITAAEP